MRNIREYFIKLIQGGFFYIVISNTMVKVVAFLGGTILVRFLSKNDYGLYSYVNNVMGFLLILGDMGTGMATLQLTQENFRNTKKVQGYCAYGFKRSVLFSIPLMLCVVLSPFYFPYKINGAMELVILLFAIPIVNNLNTYMQTNLRIHLQNRRFALLNFSSIVLHYMVLLPLSFQFGVKGAVLAQYGYGILTLCFAVLLNKKNLYIGKKYSSCLEVVERKNFVKLALPTQLNSMMAQILVLIDVFMVGYFISDQLIIASYKVATTIPSALAFIPSSIMIYAIPLFSRNKSNKQWIKSSLRKLLLCTGALCGLICVLGEVTADWIIPLIFGKEYGDAITCYKILLVGFFFLGGIQTPCVNVIYTQRKIKVNLFITLSCGVSNLLFDVMGIISFGMIGAALATAATSLMGAILSFSYLIVYVKDS